MKPWLILTRLVKEYEPTRLAEEVRKLGMEVEMVKYGQVELAVVEDRPVVKMPDGRSINDFERVITRAASKKGSSMVGTKTAMLQMVDPVKVLNGVSFAKFPLLGKLEQGLMLAKAGLPTVPFVSFGNKKGWREYLERTVFEFPVIVKGQFGSHGRTVKLVESVDDLRREYKKYDAGVVLIQPKLRVRQWYRCIVVGGEYLGEMRHRQKDKYDGEDGVMLKLSEEKMERLREIALKACELFSCEYAGLDVVYDEDRKDFVILEVNRTAQFKYFEKRTGVNVAERIVALMQKKAAA